MNITKIIQRKKKFNICYTPPIFKHSSLFFKNVKDFLKKEKKKKQTYGLEGSLVIFELENLISKIEEGKYTKIVSSGLLAIFLVYITFLKKKDYIIVPKNIYEPNLRVLNYLKKKIGFKIGFYSPIDTNLNKYKKKLVKIIFVEAPGSITFEVPNIKNIIKFKKKKPGIIIVSDNTYSCGFSFKPFKFNFDISIQALTKFYSGSNDIFMGSICTKKKKIINKIKSSYKNIGLNTSVDDSYLILRNIHNVYTNFRIHEKNSYSIAKYLKKKYKFINVLHPRIKNFCSHLNWKKFFIGSSGLFSIFFKKKISKKKIFLFIDNLKIFKLGYSWGGAISMVMFYEDHFFLNKKVPVIIRFYIGKENKKDIIKDIEKSLLKSGFLK